MSEEAPISISAAPQVLSDGVQESISMLFSTPQSPKGNPVQSLNGVKISRKPETLSSMIDNLRNVGLNLNQLIYEKTSYANDNIYFLLCKSIYGDTIAVIPPDGFNLKGGDIEVKEERSTIKYAPDGITQYYFNTVKSEYPTGFLFICNSGFQHFPHGKTESKSFVYQDFEEASKTLKTKKHHCTVIPSIDYTYLVSINRLNTLQVALEQIQDDNRYELVYRKFASALLDSELGPLMSSEAEFTLLIPPSLPEGADLVTLASHIIMGRFDYKKDGEEEFSLKSYTKSGHRVLMMYKDNFLKAIKIDKETTVEIDSERTSISKYNGVIIGLKQAMPRLEPSESIPLEQTSNLKDVFTIFDLNKLGLNIEIARKKLDVQDQNELLKTINNLNILTEDVVVKAHKLIKMRFQNYTEKMSKIQEQFYQKEIPCAGPICENYDSLLVETFNDNTKFKEALDSSGKLRFFLKELEILMLDLYSIQQELEVENPIDEMSSIDES